MHQILQDGVPIGHFIPTTDKVDEASRELNRVLASTGVRAVCQVGFLAIVFVEKLILTTDDLCG